MMRSWRGRLYLGAMPGTENTIEEWKRELADHGVKLIVCLTPPEEITAKSPAYGWTRAAGTLPPVVDAPVPNFGVPRGGACSAFWRAAFVAKAALKAGDAVFVHCGAGIGRTGMFAVAVLTLLGFSVEEAAREIAASGSFPERPEQLRFVRERRGFDPALGNTGAEE